MPDPISTLLTASRHAPDLANEQAAWPLDDTRTVLKRKWQEFGALSDKSMLNERKTNRENQEILTAVYIDRGNSKSSTILSMSSSLSANEPKPMTTHSNLIHGKLVVI